MQHLDPKAFWLFFLRAIIGWLVAILVVGGQIIPLVFLGAGKENVSLFVGGSIVFYIVVVSVFSYLYAKFSYKFYKYELTDVVFKKEHGIIWKKYVSIPYDRIQNVDIHRGVMARVLGLSDLQIQTAGGITKGSYGAFSEGRLPGVSKEEAERLRDELISKSRSSRTNQQGL